MTRRLLGVALALACALVTTPAFAKHHQHRTPHKVPLIHIAESAGCVMTNEGRYLLGCNSFQAAVELPAASIGYSDGSVIGGRPSGCPHAYCGCGTARYLGLNDPRLNLAWNWARLFPRASPGAGMAVVWHHHIALIESMVGHNEAVLRDYNAGRGLSYLHVRSIAGAVVVNPNGGMLAAL